MDSFNLLSGAVETQALNSLVIVVVGGLLLVSILGLYLIFRHVGKTRTTALNQQTLFELVKDMRKGQEFPRIEAIQVKKTQLQDELLEVEHQLETVTDSNVRQELLGEANYIEGRIKQIERDIVDEQIAVDKDASEFARTQVPQVQLNFTEQFGAQFYVEVSAIVLTVPILLSFVALGVIEAQLALPLITSILGYVLGRAAGNQPVKAKEQS